MEKLLKNIYTFANVLSQAHGEAAGHWDKRSLQNALNWAAYCEQVHKQVVGKKYVSDFDRQLKSLTMVLSSPSCLELDVRKLGIATKLVKTALLQNPYVDSDIIAELIDDELEKTTVDCWIEECFQLCQAQNAVKIARQMLHDLDPVTSRNQKCALMTQAKILFESLEKSYNHSQNTDKFIAYLQRILNQCVQHDNGMEVILRMLSISTDSDGTAREKVHEFILSWVLGTDNPARLWDVNTEVLVETAVHHFVFFKHYMQYLTHWANQMSPVYQQDDTSQLYTWRFRGTDSPVDRSYEKLVQHFHMLHAAHSDTRAAVTDLMQRLSEGSLFSIWVDLLKKLTGHIKME